MAIEVGSRILLDSKVWRVAKLAARRALLEWTGPRDRVRTQQVPLAQIVERQVPGHPNIYGFVRGRALADSDIGGAPHINEVTDAEGRVMSTTVRAKRQQPV